jgi:5,10-methylenetetrahydromethanopterin reductase
VAPRSVLLLPRVGVEELVRRAKVADTLGYRGVWIPDERFYREVYSICAIVAHETGSVTIGPAVTDPFTRHPALTAMALATLDEISGGRAVLGIGAGVSGFREMRLERRSPAAAVRDAVDLIRRLIRADGDVVFDSPHAPFEGRLDFEPVRRALPVYVAGNRPRMLRTAAAVADGVIVQACLTAGDVSAAQAEIARGLADAGKTRSEIELVLRVDVAVGETLDHAYELLRPRIARLVIQESPHFDRFRTAGVALDDTLATAVAGLHYTNDAATLEALGRYVPDTLIDAFAVAATPTTVDVELERLADIGYDHLILHLLPATPLSFDDALCVAAPHAAP